MLPSVTSPLGLDVETCAQCSDVLSFPSNVSLQNGKVTTECTDCPDPRAVLPVDSSEGETIKAREAPVVSSGTTEKERSRKSRARRLSYLDHRGEVKSKMGDASGDSKDGQDGETSEGEEVSLARRSALDSLLLQQERINCEISHCLQETAVEGAAKKRSKNARRRRLSYVVDEKEVHSHCLHQHIRQRSDAKLKL